MKNTQVILLVCGSLKIKIVEAVAMSHIINNIGSDIYLQVAIYVLKKVLLMLKIHLKTNNKLLLNLFLYIFIFIFIFFINFNLL